jgi:halimadienyl-diphosphate synthase
MTDPLISRKRLREMLDQKLEALLPMLGTGQIDTVPYDTAWIARLAPRFPGQGFDGALKWIRQHQHKDGSWGGDVLHYHDRFICTLASIVALQSIGPSPSDQRRIQKGEEYLWRNSTYLYRDAQDSIGFPVLAVSLTNEARELGLDVPSDLYCDVASIEKKLNMVSHISKAWRYNTMSFSLEAARPVYPGQPDFLEDNGSVGTSPAATVATVLQAPVVYPGALRYLRETVQGQGDGGAPNVSPIDTFEGSWVLNSLRIAQAITPDHEQVQRICKFLWDHWSPETGLGFSSFYSVHDLDDTASVFPLLRWAGYDVKAEVFSHYEEHDHFRCFPNETNPSLNSQFGMLGALRTVPHDPNSLLWINKILSFLRRQNLFGMIHFDKWHISPYYLRSTAIIASAGIADEFVVSFGTWLIRTQQPDGGWGYFDYSTPEETAYGLLALLEAKRVGTIQVPSQCIEAAANYLMSHLEDKSFVSLWMGKCLYTPRNVVRGAVIAALYSYLHYHEK